jgi:hypothetical protein
MPTIDKIPHMNPLIESLKRMEGVTGVTVTNDIYHPPAQIRLNEEHFQDNLPIPDQLRFRDDTLVKAVAALEAKADSDEPHILGAEMKALEREQKEIELLNTRPKSITEAERQIEDLLWELEMMQADLVGYTDFLGKMVERVKMLRLSLSAKNTTPS